MLFERGLAGMIFGPILDEKQVLRCLGQHAQEKGLVTWRFELASNSVMKQPSRKELNHANSFIGLALPDVFTVCVWPRQAHV